MTVVLDFQIGKKDTFDKAGRFNALVNRALCRENAAPSTMTIRRSNGAGLSREKVICDFTKAANLELLDRHIMPVIQRLVQRARKDEMTGVLQEFSEQALYAIDTLGSVAAKSHDEITQILYPRPPVIMGQLLSFRPRTA